MIRVGHSWDTHKLVEGRRLILGGVELDSPVGLLGHSDADVVLHAVAESFLGALALGDLGSFYPDNSDKTLNMDSKIILKECYQRVIDNGYRVNNIDLTIYSQEIRISPIRQRIRESIAALLSLDIDQVSVKATTWEKMGFVGRGEAIACEAVCLVESMPKKVYGRKLMETR
ncbi:MAG: 2-C-methyl-D-erythritol 2,4-cyclodiphosphate synthase [Acholeplasmatales bacterium]|nr:2-C-methyl-D-erythritol 2,4-cyclodiphosphate synthase [Acholeplasmatales bacterium]